jgi:nucleoid-associated protein YgaU
MGRFSMYLGVGLLLVVAVTPTQCRESPPPGSVPYVTKPGDTPYYIAKRVYGKGYLQDRIIMANRSVLSADGTFPPGITIAIPPNLNGEPVDTTKFLKNP